MKNKSFLLIFLVVASAQLLYGQTYLLVPDGLKGIDESRDKDIHILTNLNIKGNFTGNQIFATTLLPSDPRSALNISGNLNLMGTITGNQSGALRISSPTGYVDIGSQTIGYSIINTDRAYKIKH
jgi:hypothetical protein